MLREVRGTHSIIDSHGLVEARVVLRSRYPEPRQRECLLEPSRSAAAAPGRERSSTPASARSRERGAARRRRRRSRAHGARTRGVALMAKGRSNKAIWAQLVLSPKTIEAHAKQILRTLDESADDPRGVLATRPTGGLGPSAVARDLGGSRRGAVRTRFEPADAPLGACAGSRYRTACPAGMTHFAGIALIDGTPRRGFRIRDSSLTMKCFHAFPDNRNS